MFTRLNKNHAIAAALFREHYQKKPARNIVDITRWRALSFKAY